MLYILVSMLTVFCSSCLAHGDVKLHPMFPLPSVIERGSTLERFCSLGKTHSPDINASHIIWTLNEDRIAKENYIIINDSVSGVVIHNFTYGEAHVKCYVDFRGQQQLLGRAVINSGFPPQSPENISCINYLGKNITCSWTLEQDTYIETYYTIIIKQHPNNTKPVLNQTWKSTNVSRSHNFPTPIFYPEFCIQVKLKNLLGKAESPCVLQSSDEIMKIEPNHFQVGKIQGMKKMLRVSLEGAGGKTTCRIRYKNMKQNDSKEVTTEVTTREISGPIFVNLTNLWSYTEYAIAIQCKTPRSRLWSEWSREQIGTTEEEAPSKEVDLWRILEECQPSGSRRVHLFWKPLKENESLGTIQGYRIKCFTQSNRSLACANDTTDKLVTVQLMGQAYVVSVTAYNAAGNSPEAVLRIPSCAEESKDHPRVVTLNASVLNEYVIVEWKTSDSDINSYVVEWYDVSAKDAPERSWQYVRNTTKWTFQKGVFKHYRCYNISVYPVYKDEIKAPSSIRTYFKQGRPSSGPVAEVLNTDKNEATIKWKELEEGEANGDIISYTIFYSPDGFPGKEIGKTVNASLLQYRIKSLQANVGYTAHVMASTIAGGTNGSAISFHTNLLSGVDTVIIQIFFGLLILCLLTFGLFWALKKHELKRIFWPKIPRPNIPEMSQDYLEKPLKEPQSEKTVIPEVISILKVDDNDDCQLLKLEDCLGQTDTEEALGQHEASGSGEHEGIELLLQTAPSPGQHFRNQLLPASVIQQLHLQKSEASLSEDDQNSSCKDKEKQDQANIKEKTEPNPYLKNSVHTREFLVSVPKKKERKKEAVLASPCVSSGNGQQYVVLDTIVLTEH